MATAVQHGSYLSVTPYRLVQHRYAASQIAFVEMLEINNPPDLYGGIVLHTYGPAGSRHLEIPYGSIVTEWDTVEHACRALEVWANQFTGSYNLLELDGFIRELVYGEQTPWFYLPPEVFQPRS